MLRLLWQLIVETPMTNLKRQILVTTALPYANGPLHLGHMVEQIQADIWVRFQRSKGHTCHFVCGEDAHGTPVMLQAEKKGIPPEKLVSDYQMSHHASLNAFNIAQDNFYTTHSEENKTIAREVYQKLKANGDITTREIKQAFDPEKEMFLPDRYVKGECPKCHATDQYGDSCEACGAHYSPTELINPISAVSGATPVEKTSTHYFFCLDKYQDLLETWTKEGHLQPEIVNKLNEWFEAGLQQWDISRDGPYFGFEIPDAPGKYFYVWMDAPFGYMASFKNLCDKDSSIDFETFWQPNSESELYHFIGKDIVYFHALFWPAMLKGSGFKTPNGIHVHGFLTVDGEKMSKSRGTFITADTYLRHLNPECLRYYFAAKLGDGIDDIDLNFEDFINRVNADLVGKYVNIASRCAGFIGKQFNHQLSEKISDETLLNDFIGAGEQIAEHLQSRSFSRAVREIMQLADCANRYIDEKKPWILIKSEETRAEAHEVCSLGIHLFRLLTIYLQPILPIIAEAVGDFLNDSQLSWNDREKVLTGHTIQSYKPLLQRITQEQVTAMIEESKDIANESSNEPAKETHLTNNPIKPEITIDDFAKCDFRIAKIAHAESVPEAKKLIKLTLDLGGETRQVFAGIKSAFEPEDLIGKLTVMVANLAPRKMRFGLSEGMVLVASGKDKDGLFLLEPEDGAEPGMQVS